MDYHDRYAELVQQILSLLGRKARAKDGVSEAAIRWREKELGLRFPASLRAYHRVAGNLPELNRMHNIIYALSELYVEDGHLFVMEENQAVVHWCLRLGDLDQDDPEVWQRVNNDPYEWYSEEMPLSAVLSDTLRWEAGLDEQTEVT